MQDKMVANIPVTSFVRVPLTTLFAGPIPWPRSSRTPGSDRAGVQWTHIFLFTSMCSTKSRRGITEATQ